MKIYDRFKLLRLMNNGLLLAIWKTLGWALTGHAYISPEKRSWYTKGAIKRKSARQIMLIQEIVALRNSHGRRGMLGIIDNSFEVAVLEAKLYGKDEIGRDVDLDFPEDSPILE